MLALQTVSYLLLTYFQLSQATFTPKTPFPEGRAEYLVVMDNVTDEWINIHNTWLYKEMESRPLAQIKKHFDMSNEGFVAYHGNFAQDMAYLIAARPNVEYMEVNGKVTINAAVMSPDQEIPADLKNVIRQYIPDFDGNTDGSTDGGSGDGSTDGGSGDGSNDGGSGDGSDDGGSGDGSTDGGSGDGSDDGGSGDGSTDGGSGDGSNDRGSHYGQPKKGHKGGHQGNGDSSGNGSGTAPPDNSPPNVTAPANPSKTSTTQSSVKNYGLTMISESKGKTYSYPSNGGEGVVVYVIDTGINVDHEDFKGGRAEMLDNFVDGEEATDLDGHGTHVSGIVGGAISGIAKKVKIYGVKVLGADGNGDSSGVISGIQAVVKHHKKRGQGAKSVINMSLGSSGGGNGGTARAIKAAAKAGIHVAVAAGNDHADACDGAPAGPEDAFVVASVGRSKQPSDFSNTGSCVNINAPGENIKSADVQQTDGFVSMSGTSMASPHVAGVLALTLGEKDGSPSEIRKLLIQNAEASVQGADQDTTDKLISTKFLLKGLSGDGTSPAQDDTPNTDTPNTDTSNTDTHTVTPKKGRRKHQNQ